MKHIGWCLEKIQIIMGAIPKEVNSQEDKAKANKILDEIQKYANTLEELITHSNFKKYIYQLENTSIEGIKLHGYEIEELFKSLEHMLYELDLYIKNLREIIINNPEEWRLKADQIVLMIYQKFTGERAELRKEFQISLHEKEELKQLISSEEHLAEFLK